MDLSLASIKELQDEIDKRFDTVVLLTAKIRKDKEMFDYHHFGGHMTAIGLCEAYAFTLKNQKEAEETEEFYQD